MNQETFIKAQILERTFKEAQEKIAFLENQISELEKFRETVLSIKKADGKEILTPLGKGVHAKASLSENSFFVEVGSGVVVKKTTEQLVETIDSQVSNLMDARAHITGELEIARHNLISLLEDVESSQRDQL